MRRKITLAAMLAVAALSISGCRYGRPGHDSDHHHGHHDRDHDHDHYR